MREITKYVANDGTEFEDETKCMIYENNLSLIPHKNDFALFDENKYPSSLEDIEAEDVYYVVVKNPRGAMVLGDWFEKCGDINPFLFTDDKDCIGTWAYTDSTGWIKLEDAIQKYTSIITELNK